MSHGRLQTIWSRRLHNKQLLESRQFLADKWRQLLLTLTAARVRRPQPGVMKLQVLVELRERRLIKQQSLHIASCKPHTLQTTTIASLQVELGPQKTTAGRNCVSSFTHQMPFLPLNHQQCQSTAASLQTKVIIKIFMYTHLCSALWHCWLRIRESCSSNPQRFPQQKLLWIQPYTSCSWKTDQLN